MIASATRWIRRAALFLVLASALLPVAAGAQEVRRCDVPRAESLADSGWTLWATANVAEAKRYFRRAAIACPGSADAWIGLAYAALREDSASLAAARFDSALARGGQDRADAWVGLGLATFRMGERGRARSAFLRADSLAPNDPTTTSYLARLAADAPLVAPPRPPRPATRRVAARAGRGVLEVPGPNGSWTALYIKGVNLGAALPGRYPSEFPPDDGTYEGWIQDVADLGANTLRVYTVHPPHFYRALAEWNRAHPTRVIWLLHGVWTELPPGEEESEFDDRDWWQEFRQEMHDVVDLIHGAAAITPRPGRQGGRYAVDVSPWTLGFLLGREWEPYAVAAYAARHPTRTEYRGTYLEVNGGNAMDVRMAEAMDTLVAYEMRHYHAQRPVAYTNWPTLDPLRHESEATREEEAAMMAARGMPELIPPLAHDDDAVTLDATLMHATAAFPAGHFAAYHIYPYFPDFLVNEDRFASVVGPDGPSRYYGYVEALTRHHGDVPLVVAEYGIPSSRGNAHWQPEGLHHGGHDEQAQGAIIARLEREIHAAGTAGGIAFALIDEWFKRTWVTSAFYLPSERNLFWHNVLDPEQHYGLIAMRSGKAPGAVRIDGARDDWAGRPPLMQRPATAPTVDPALRLDALSAHADASFLYLRLDVGTVDFSKARYVIGIDTHDPAAGGTRLPYGGSPSPVGLEFILDLKGTDDAHLLIDAPYNPYVLGTVRGYPYWMQGWEFRSRSNSEARFDTLRVTINRPRVTRANAMIPPRSIALGALRHGRESENSHADWYADPQAGTIELRIPWGLLMVTDPSSHQVLLGATRAGGWTAVRTPGFGFVVESVPVGGGTGDRLPRGAAAPFAMPPPWIWPGWDEPSWHAERKPAFTALQRAFTEPRRRREP